MSETRSVGDILDSKSITHKFDKEKLVFLNTSDVLEGKILIDNYMDVADMKGQAKKTIQNGDILFSEIRPKNKRYAFVNVPNPEDYVVSTKLMVLRNKTKDVLTKYIYYFLTYEGTLNYLQMRAENRIGSFPQITFDILKELKVNVPKPAIQQKIVDILSALDAKIELNQRINAELESMAKTLYDYWFVQYQYPHPSSPKWDRSTVPFGGGAREAGGGGGLVWNEALKREIPLGWEVKALSEITEVSTTTVNPMNFPKKQFKHYSIPAFDETGTYKIELGEEILSNKFTVKKSDLLVSKLNPWFSRVVYSVNDTDLICSSEFVVWRTENTATKNYLYMVAKDTAFIDYCTRSASGTSHSHRRVNPQVMMKYQVPYNEEVALKFGSVIAPMIETLAKNRLESQTLTELRDWLLPMLMNGQVKV